MADRAPTVAGRASRALGWSFANTVVSRLGTLAIGIALARVLGPSTRAREMPLARVPRRETTVFAKLQPRAREARPATVGARSAIGHRGAERGSHQLLLNLGQVREHRQRQ